MRRFTKAVAIAGAAAIMLAVAGCGEKKDSGSDDDGGATTTKEGTSDITVGLAYDVGGRGDQSFNDSAAKGVDQAAKEYGYGVKESEAQDGEPESAREERLRTFAEEGIDPIIAVGFAYETSLEKVAAEYPDTHFAIVDSEVVQADNVANLVFSEEQGSFLVGAAAALKTKTDHIAFVGGVNVPLINKFEAGYVAGATEVNPDIQIDTQYLTEPPDFSGFGDPAKGKTAAQGMFDGGADVVYHAAGGSGGGVFEAAKAANGWAIGVDSDQYVTADKSLKDVILTSMLKNIDVGVHEYLTAVDGGEFPSGVTRYDLSQDGVGYSTSGGFVDDITKDLDKYKQQIIDGDIEVPTEP